MREIAYTCRHGRQPYSEVMAMGWREFRQFYFALAGIVRRGGPFGG